MSSAVRRVVQIEHTQLLELDTEHVYSERVVTRLIETGDALTSGWLRLNFSKNPVDYLVLHGILHHTRPLVGQDFEQLMALKLVTLEDKGRLYARITDIGLAEILGPHRTTIAAAAQRLADKGLIRIAQIPDEILRRGGLRDSHGKFEGNCIYLISGDFGNVLSKEMKSRQAVLEEVGGLVSLTDTVTHGGLDGVSQTDTDRLPGSGGVGQTDTAGQIFCKTDPIRKQQNRLPVSDQPTEGVDQTDINESLKESNKKESGDDISSSDSFQDSLKATDQKLLADLLAVGVYPETAPGLIREFPEREIRAWLDLLPAALESGYATTPGWIPTVLRRQFHYERVKTHITRKLASRVLDKPVAQAPVEPVLPDDVIEDLRAMGWSDSFTLVEKCWQEDPDRVDEWIAYILKVFDELENPPGRLRRGLESGNPPPSEKKRWKADLPSATRNRNDPYAANYS